MTTTPERVATYPPLRAARPLTPYVAHIHCVAAFITQHQLPEGDITFLKATGVLVSLTDELHPAGAVMQWAIALGSEPTEEHEIIGGRLSIMHTVTGYTPEMIWVKVASRKWIHSTSTVADHLVSEAGR